MSDPYIARRLADPYCQRQLARFRVNWRWLMARDYPEMVRKSGGRAALIARVREDLDHAFRPEPTQRYGAPGWPLRKRPDGKAEPLPILPAEIAAWRARDPVMRGGAPVAHPEARVVPLRVQTALAFLDTFRRSR